MLEKETTKECCEDMQASLYAYLDCDFKGENHTPFNCEQTLIYKGEKCYGLIYHDQQDELGGIIPIAFCPFCGTKLNCK